MAAAWNGISIIAPLKAVDPDLAPLLSHCLKTYFACKQDSDNKIVKVNLQSLSVTVRPKPKKIKLETALTI